MWDLTLMTIFINHPLCGLLLIFPMWDRGVTWHDSLQSAAVWKMVSSCLSWCLWRKMNDKSFENSKKTVVELKDFFLNTLYLWTIALDFPMCLIFNVFFIFFPFLNRCLSCILSACVLELHLCIFYKISITWKKNRKRIFCIAMWLRNCWALVHYVTCPSFFYLHCL
jgi:hypothetical protein